LHGNQRIKIDWIYPDCLGLKGNKLDQLNSIEVPPNLRKKFFVQLCLEIGKRLNIKWNDVLQAFFGNKQNLLSPLKK
jgi:hypothetical protein